VKLPGERQLIGTMASAKGEELMEHRCESGWGVEEHSPGLLLCGRHGILASIGLVVRRRWAGHTPRRAALA